MLTIGNPLGFLALLAIPVIVAIHFLQRKSQVETITTLFLLDQMQRESLSGNRFERIRSSIPLWMQILMALILTWLLIEPRWLREDSVQRVAVVADSSASMTVFKDDAIAELDRALEDIARASARSEYVGLDSRASNERLYHGADRADLLAALREWRPRFGTHDPASALRLARTLVGADGVVVFLTDHPGESEDGGELPFGALRLAAGSPTDNVGFAGLSVGDADGQPVWRALIRSYSDKPQTRSWFLEAGGARTEPREVVLEPGEAISVQGPFLEGRPRCVLRLTGDDFAMDDMIPMVRPEPKRLSLVLAGRAASNPVYQRLFESFEHVDGTVDAAEADVIATSYSPLDPSLPGRNGFVFIADPRKDAQFSKERVLAQLHPLTRDLNWQGLITRETLAIPPRTSDITLVWQGDRPLIFLRPVENGEVLCFNFDLDKSNAERLPAFVVMIHRFLENVRERKIGLETINAETGQDLEFAFSVAPDAPNLVYTAETVGGRSVTAEFPLLQASLIDAPPAPGFFEISQGETSLVHGAAHFADAREADLRNAGSADEASGVRGEIVEEHSEHDPLWQLWILLLLAAAAVSWIFSKKSLPSAAGDGTLKTASAA